MSQTKQTKKLDLKQQTLRTLDAHALRGAAGGIGDYLVLKDIQSRGRGTVDAP